MPTSRCIAPRRANARRLLLRDAMDEAARERRARWRRAAGSDGEGQFELHYQPIAASRGEMIGFEALIRWQPSRARPGSAGRVHSARRGNRPHRADRRMGAAQACREAAALAEPAARSPSISRRASSGSSDLCRHVVSVLDETGLAAEPARARDHRIAMHHRHRAHACTLLTQLKALGVAHRHRRFRHRLFVAELAARPSPSTRSSSTAASFRPSRLMPAISPSCAPSSASAPALTRRRWPKGSRRKSSCRSRAEGFSEVQGYLLGRPMPQHEAEALIDGRALKAASSRR